ncbi:MULTISPECIES: glutathione S-transferase C-terminal domain-containing protein [Massilia]|jgi:glutathione S-transferase|uniref:glutathione S-transferase C-terminal domain-containing protein n=1 Tax=Massilia TaxID=149698 RepID=UPI00041E8308|nr:MULTISPECIES: glutathione S-transferase C-terminal domain-containing protein [Massilia]MDK6078007.1 glutathione S-transferase N-terminal domain-containing protein [Massilia varians]
MKLIGSFTSPYVRKVRVVMADKKLDVSFVQENVWVPETTIQQVNPLGKIPCLVMEDGSTLYDSRVIAEYLDTISPVCKLLPPNGRERTEVKVWEALADGVLDAAILVFLERRERSPEQQSAKWIERQMGKVHAGLREMSTRLGESSYCMGIHYTLADVAVGCALGWLAFRFPDIDWRGDYPNLARLADKLAERPSFRDTVPFVA